MTLQREEVLQTLKLAAPALLSENDAVLPILKCLRFTGTHVIASNDVIAVSLSTPVKEEAIVSGRSLISFLSACRSKDVEFKKTGKGNLVVKCASPKLNLSSFPEDEWPFEMPDMDKVKSFKLKKTFFEAMEFCSAQSPDIGLASWQGGIIFSMTKETFEVYGVGQSRSTISQYSVKEMSSKKARLIVVPSSFCKLAVSMSKSIGTKARLLISEDGVLIDWGKGKNTIMTKLIHSDMPDIVARFGGIVFETGNYREITPSMKDALKRASIIGDKGTCTIASEKGGLRVRASGRGASLNDLVKFGKDEKAPKVPETQIAADLICRRMDQCGTIGFGPTATVMKDQEGTFTYVVAHRSELDNKEEED